MATIPSTAAARTFRLACRSAATGGAGGAISSDSRTSGCSKSGPFFGYGWPFVCGRSAGGKRLSTAATVTGSGAGTGGGEGGGTTTLGGSGFDGGGGAATTLGGSGFGGVGGGAGFGGSGFASGSVDVSGTASGCPHPLHTSGSRASASGSS